MAACWRCGTQVPFDANYCPSCGVSVRAEMELDVFTDRSVTGDHVEAAAPRSSRWVAIGAVVLLGGLGAFFAFLSDDDGEPSADPFEERANFDATDDDPQPEPTAPDVGEETELPPARVNSTLDGDLGWTTTFEGPGFPLAVVPLGPSTFVYTSTNVLAWQRGGTASAYERTRDGNWIDHGLVIDGATVTSIAPSDDGAIAVGTNEAGHPTVWRSSDGLTWAAEQLPISDDTTRNADPLVVVASGNTTIVWGAEPNAWTELQNAISARYPDLGVPVGLETYEGQGSVEVVGPFGLTVVDLGFAELGLAADDLWSSTGGPSVSWTNTGDGWIVEPLSAGATSLINAEGTILQTVAGSLGPEVSTFDDSEWSEPISFPDPWSLSHWGDRYVTTDQSGVLSVFGADFAMEERLQIPDHRFGHDVSATIGTDAGLVVFTTNWDADDASDDERVILLRDGYTVEARTGELQIRQGDDILVREFRGGSNDNYRVDIDATPPTVTFLDSVGAPLVTFTLSELAELEAVSPDPGGAPTTNHRLLFTRDGEGWHGGDFADTDVWLTEATLVDDQLLGVMFDASSWFLQSTDIEFRVIEAPVPD
ncbi:MAG: zinc ribbon domain-containing protein [Actinomycetota bacterium]